jgi:hypothetical protein
MTAKAPQKPKQESEYLKRMADEALEQLSKIEEARVTAWAR